MPLSYQGCEAQCCRHTWPSTPLDYTSKLKVQVINFYQSAALVVGIGASKRWASSRYGIPYNTVRKWLSSSRCATILSDSNGSHCTSVKSAAERCYLKSCDAPWREALGQVKPRVLREFTCFRARGLKVSARTVCRWAASFRPKITIMGLVRICCIAFILFVHGLALRGHGLLRS